MIDSGRDSIALSYNVIIGEELSTERTDRVAFFMAKYALGALLSSLDGSEDTDDSSFLEAVDNLGSFRDKVVAALIYAQYKTDPLRE